MGGLSSSDFQKRRGRVAGELCKSREVLGGAKERSINQQEKERVQPTAMQTHKPSSASRPETNK